MRRGRRSGLYTIVAVHSTARGPSLGGCRMWGYERLARRGRRRAAALARDDVQVRGRRAPARRRQGRDHAARRRAARSSRSGGATRCSTSARRVAQLDGRYVTAEDVGTSDADMTVIAEQTEHVAGLALERGGSGDPSPWTALGVETAIRVDLRARLGHRRPRGPQHRRDRARQRRRRARARARGRRRARSSLADVAPASARSPRSSARRGRSRARRCAPTSTSSRRARSAACSTTTTVPLLRCRAIAGAANNQLASDEIADELHARGILWAPDFVANAGGIINIAVELEPEGYSAERARARVLAIGDTLGTVLDMAEARARRRWRRRRSSRGGGWRRPGRRREGAGRVLRGAGTSLESAPMRYVERRSPRADPKRRPFRSMRRSPRPAPGSQPLRQPPLLAQLLQVRLQRPAPPAAGAPRAPRPTPPRAARPPSRAPAVERGDDPALALQPVRDVLVELRRRVVDDRAVARVAAARGPARAAGAGRRGTRRASRRPAR